MSHKYATHANQFQKCHLFPTVHNVKVHFSVSEDYCFFLKLV
jgi:hypothetical protein